MITITKTIVYRCSDGSKYSNVEDAALHELQNVLIRTSTSFPLESEGRLSVINNILAYKHQVFDILKLAIADDVNTKSRNDVNTVSLGSIASIANIGGNVNGWSNGWGGTTDKPPVAIPTATIVAAGKGTGTCV